MSDNWVVGNLQNAINTWNGKLSEIWSLLSQSPETFEFKKDYFKMGDRYGRVLFIKDVPTFLKDDVISELTELNKNMILLDKHELQNGNSFILGVSGSGKSIIKTKS